MADNKLINDDFFTELKKRSKSFKDGSAKTYTWEQAKKAAIKKVKSKNHTSNS